MSSPTYLPARPGTRAVFRDASGGVVVASVVFWRTCSEPNEHLVPMVPNDHDYPTALVEAGDLGAYALLGPEDDLDKKWVEGLSR